MKYRPSNRTSIYRHLVSEIDQALLICIVKYMPDKRVLVRRVLEKNNKLESLTGIKNKPMLTLAFSRILSNLRFNHFDDFDQIINEGGKKSFEYKFKRQKNEYINLRLNLSSPSHNILLILIKDETEQHKREKAIEDKDQLLQEAQSIAKISNWQINVRTKEHIWSTENYRILEYPESERPKMDLFKRRLHPEDCDAVLHALADAIEYRHNINISFRLLVNNKIKFVRCTGKIATDENGNEFLMATTQDISPLFHSRLELEQSEKKYLSLFHSLDSATLVLSLYTREKKDDEGKIHSIEKIRFIEVNKAMEKIAAKPVEKIINRDIDEVFPLLNIERIMSTIKQVIQNGEKRQFVITRSQNKNSYLNCTMFKPHWDNDNFCVIMNDITDQVITQKRNLEGENRLRNLLQHMPVMLVAYDSEGRILVWNKECERITGYLASEIIGINDFYSLLMPNRSYKEYVLEMLKKLKKTYRNLEWDITCRNGSARSIAWSNMSRQFNIPGWDAWEIGIDITETKKAIAALRKSQEKSKSMIEAIPDIIFAIDNNGTFTSFNSPEGYLVGNFGSRITGARMEEIFPRELSSLFYQKLRETEESGSTQDFEFSFEEKGQLEHFEGRMLSCGEHETMAIIRNITDSKHLKEELSQAEKMQAIGQLAGGIAHDFNNQLMGILSFADLLRETITDEQEKKYLEQIITAAQRSADLTNQMLAFSRKGKYQEKAISVHTIIRELSILLQHSLDKKINLKFKLNSSRSMIHGDISQLQNAMLNLCLNARDAMPNGGLLQIETREMTLDASDPKCEELKLEAGDYIEILFKDTGVGISESIIDHIFEPFYTTKKAGEGTGMGLAAVFGTIENHKGNISVKSRIGNGSTFCIALPLADVSESESSSFQLELPLEKGTSCGNLMIVDDESIIREALVRILTKLGYHAVSFGKGNMALKYYRDNYKTIDLVLLDMIMPDNTGLELFELLKKVNPEIKAVFLSGYTDGNSDSLLMKEGIEDFIKKPVSQQDLSARIARILTKGINKNLPIPPSTEEPENEEFSKQKALENLGGDENLYKKMLLNFIKDTEDFGSVINTLFNENDFEQLYRKCHNLKSLSGAIGAFQLMNELEEGEKNIKEGKIDQQSIDQMTENINHIRDFLLEGFLYSEIKPSNPDSKPEGKTARLRLFINDMKQPLETHQPREALELLDIVNSFNWSNQLQGKINDLQDAVSNYRFNSALDQIFELLEELDG